MKSSNSIRNHLGQKPSTQVIMQNHLLFFTTKHVQVAPCIARIFSSKALKTNFKSGTDIKYICNFKTRAF